jgi:hypothetical protein
MEAVTKLRIQLTLEEGLDIKDAIGELPGYCRESFREHKKGSWNGEFIVSCPVAPELAAGDFVDDLSPYFPQLLRIKTFHDAEFEFQIAVGAPAPDEFWLESHSVAMLAALGAKITVVNQDSKREGTSASTTAALPNLRSWPGE